MPRSVGKTLEPRKSRPAKSAKLDFPPRIMKNAPDKTIIRKIGEYFRGQMKSIISEFVIDSLKNFDEKQRWCK